MEKQQATKPESPFLEKDLQVGRQRREVDLEYWSRQGTEQGRPAEIVTILGRSIETRLVHACRRLWAESW